MPNKSDPFYQPGKSLDDMIAERRARDKRIKAAQKGKKGEGERGSAALKALRKRKEPKMGIAH